MATDLTTVMSAEEINLMQRSHLAWSTADIVFTPDGKLVLGLRTVQPQSIPEPGDYALIGGFNTMVAGPAMYRQVANAHMKAQLGIELYPGQSSGFIPCEYDMESIKEPLVTPNGKFNIKRTAFDRITLLTPEQAANLEPQGKLKGIEIMTEHQFERLATTGQLSFPHEVENVRHAFKLRVHEQGIPTGKSWTFTNEQEALAALRRGDVAKAAHLLSQTLQKSRDFIAGLQAAVSDTIER